MLIAVDCSHPTNPNLAWCGCEPGAVRIPLIKFLWCSNLHKTCGCFPNHQFVHRVGTIIFTIHFGFFPPIFGYTHVYTFVFHTVLE